MKANAFSRILRGSAFAWVISCFFMQCSDEEVIPEQRDSLEADSLSVVQPATPAKADDCSECAYIVPKGAKVIDGKKLKLMPGDTIGLDAAITYGSLEFTHLVGKADQPIIIRNFGGRANIIATNTGYGLLTNQSKHFRITGGTTPGVYGIYVEGGRMGLKLDGLSTNFEVDHVEVANAGFAGIMAKTDPTCDDETIRGNFTMYDVSLHNNYVHDTGGEGFYVGNSFWDGMERSCGLRLPHEIKGLKIFDNKVKNTDWDGIQVGCAVEGAEIYNNTIENFGIINRTNQNCGIQIGSGTGGLAYNNLIKKGTGNGMVVLGLGDNVIYNNIIVDAGANGIFCDERYTPGEGFKFINNTIINPGKDGIRLYAELVPMNTIVNNLIVSPGTLGTYTGLRSDDDSFLYLATGIDKLQNANNLFVKSMDKVQFIAPASDNYRLKSNSPAINFGKDISKFNINHDFYRSARKNGAAYDAGASEF